MDLLTKIKGLSHIGWRNVAAAIRFSIQRSVLERRLVPRKPRGDGLSPGNLVDAASIASGHRLIFERAELEIRYLAPDLVRVTWQPGVLPVPYALAQKDWSPVEVAIRALEDGWSIASIELTVDVGRDGSISYGLEGGAAFRHDKPPLLDDDRWTHRARALPGEHYYGLGERTAPMNLRGGIYRLWNREPKGHYTAGDDPIYICIPVYLGLHTQGSYLVFFENSHDGEISFSDDAVARFEGGALRYYVIPGPPARALERFTELTGRAPLPPRWSLGFHQSRWSYANETEVRELVEGFQRRELPLSAVHLDIHYMDGYRVFTFDSKRFPDPAGLTVELAEKGVRTVMILDPGVKRDPAYEVYREGLENEFFCRLPDSSPVVAPVWAGNCCFPDFTDPSVRTWWGDHYQNLLEHGAGGVWHDMNEPAAFTAWGETTLPSATRHDMDGRGGNHIEAHNLYALQQVRAGFEAMRRLRPDRRPWLLSRSGWAGCQRYTWTWTGDSESDWWSVRQSLRIAISLGLTGIPYSGPDIGGFGGKPNEELFTRWFQLAAFLPFFRVHSAGFTPRREPWSFGQPTLRILREFLRLRYRLILYLYTLAWQCSRSGRPLVRPLWFEAPHRTEYWDVDDTFFLGPSLLVAPIVTEGSRSRAVSVPDGGWYSFWDDELIEGPVTHPCQAPLDRIPLFVRAGRMLPTQEEDRLVLHLYLPLSDRTMADIAPKSDLGIEVGQLYNDAGDGYGDWRLDRFWLDRADGRFRLSRTHEGRLAWPWPEAQLAIHPTGPVDVEVDGVHRSVVANRVSVGEFKEIRWR